MVQGNCFWVFRNVAVSCANRWWRTVGDGSVEDLVGGICRSDQTNAPMLEMMIVVSARADEL